MIMIHVISFSCKMRHNCHNGIQAGHVFTQGEDDRKGSGSDTELDLCESKLLGLATLH